MRKSLFKKIFLTFTAVVFVAFFVLGAVILAFTGSFWVGERQSILLKEAVAVSDQVNNLGGNMYYVSKITEIVASSSGNHIMIASNDGSIAVAEQYILDKNTKIPESVMSRISSENGYSEIGTLDGLLSTKSVVVSAPIISGGEVIGAVFDFTEAEGLNFFLKDILRILVVSGMGVMIFLLLAAYIITEHMVRPIREMAEAARCMSRGDFTKYIRVDREDEIGELAVAFNNMTKSLSASEQLRRSFVANVSHELKTPMTTISGFIDGILDGTIEGEEQHKYLEIVSVEVKRLSRLVTSMLNLSKLEAGEVAIRPAKVDLTKTLVDIALQLEQNISKKDISVEGMDELTPCIVTTDSDLIHQVIFNLVDNAIKYTPENGTISVKNVLEGNTAKLYIRNTGTGIPEKDLPFIFDRFYKVDKSRGTDKKGTGLGLYLVKTILSLLGGQITVKSTEGSYCEFVITLNTSDNISAKELPKNGKQ